MVCLNPKPVKFSWYNKIDENTGEIYKTKKLKFRSYWEHLDENSDWIPCGKCEGCRIDKANDNATKAYLESQNWPYNAFLTLTYDNIHLPPKKSLRKRDLQLFWKKLRKTIKPQKIKYLACGEYGPITKRPHYHAAVFNYWPKDAKPFKKNEIGNILYTSEKLTKIWGNGFVIIGNLTYESAAYIARYVYKKAFGADKTEIKKGKEPEFTTCSKRPALAKNYFENPTLWAKLIRNNGVLIYTKSGLKIKKIPQSLKNYFKNWNHDEYYKWAETNKLNQKNKQKLILSKTDLNFGWYNKTIQSLKKKQLTRLDKHRNNL